ncbi:unnamed protein product, partial [Citrullus colocynthis]
KFPKQPFIDRPSPRQTFLFLGRKNSRIGSQFFSQVSFPERTHIALISAYASLRFSISLRILFIIRGGKERFRE